MRDGTLPGAEFMRHLKATRREDGKSPSPGFATTPAFDFGQPIRNAFIPQPQTHNASPIISLLADEHEAARSMTLRKRKYQPLPEFTAL